MGGRWFIVRMAAASPPGGLVVVFDRLYRLVVLLGSCKPDDLNMLVVRLVTRSSRYAGTSWPPT